MAESNVRCQWDPDRDIYCNTLEDRAIQLGLKGAILWQYVNKWIVDIKDITGDLQEIKDKSKPLPIEVEYEVTDEIKKILGV